MRAVTAPTDCPGSDCVRRLRHRRYVQNGKSGPGPPPSADEQVDMGGEDGPGMVRPDAGVGGPGETAHEILAVAVISEEGLPFGPQHNDMVQGAGGV